MAKHGITIPSRKQMTEPVEHPSIRQNRIDKQTRKFFREGGHIEKIPFGFSGDPDGLSGRKSLTSKEKKRMYIKRL